MSIWFLGQTKRPRRVEASFFLPGSWHCEQDTSLARRCSPGSCCRRNLGPHAQTGKGKNFCQVRLPDVYLQRSVVRAFFSPFLNLGGKNIFGTSSLGLAIFDYVVWVLWIFIDPFLPEMVTVFCVMSFVLFYVLRTWFCLFGLCHPEGVLIRAHLAAK